MNKLLLGLLIGLGITFSCVSLAGWIDPGQWWQIGNISRPDLLPTYVHKLRDGKVICYVVEGSAISCLAEPQ